MTTDELEKQDQTASIDSSTTSTTEPPQQRLRIDQLVAQLFGNFQEQVFALVPEVSAVAVIINWEFPVQDGLPTGLVARPEGRPMHAGERAKLIRGLAKCQEQIMSHLLEEVAGLEQLGSDLGKKIQQQAAAAKRGREPAAGTTTGQAPEET